MGGVFAVVSSPSVVEAESSESRSELMSTMVWVEWVEVLDLEVEAAALATSETVGSSLLLSVTVAELLHLKWCKYRFINT